MLLNGPSIKNQDAEDSQAFLTTAQLGKTAETADQPQRGPVREQQLIVGIIMRIEMHQ